MAKGGVERVSPREARQAAIMLLAHEKRWSVVDETAWEELGRAFDGVSERTLRHDLRACELPVHPLVEGVRLDSVDELARSLLGLAECHSQAMEAHPRTRMSAARKRVLDARRKAEAVLRNPRVAAEKRAAMEEKLLWLRTWLENPELFAVWAPLRLEKVRNPERDF